MLELETFKTIAKPYRGKYAEKVHDPDDLFDSTKWITKHEYLPDWKIEQALTGQITRAYYSSFMPQCLCVDIDDHNGKAWTGKAQASPLLLSLYQTVRNRLGEPSFLVQSPRGLHCYYAFDQRIPAGLLYQRAKETLGTTLAEIRPTPDTALRIPEKDRILDPATLTINTDFDFENMTVHHPAIILGLEVLPEEIKKRTTLADRKSYIQNLNKAHVIKIENENPFIDGQSNETLNILVPVYKKARLTVNEAFDRINTLMESSQFYTRKTDTTGNQLLNRIQCYYDRTHIDRVINIPQQTLFDSQAIKELVTQSPFARQRNKPIEKFLTELYQWKNYQDEILKDKGTLAYFDYLYPFYRNNRKQGLYPLPRNLMTRWNDRYNELTAWLNKIDILTPSQYRYNPIVGICKYYQVKDTGHILSAL